MAWLVGDGWLEQLGSCGRSGVRGARLFYFESFMEVTFMLNCFGPKGGKWMESSETEARHRCKARHCNCVKMRPNSVESNYHTPDPEICSACSAIERI